MTDLLRRQHQEIRSLFAQVEQVPGDQRSETFECLRRLLAVHETAEEVVVHPTARELGPAGRAVVDQRLEEERAAKQLLSDLDGMATDDEGFGTRLVELRRAVEDHADAEEAVLLPLLEAEVSTEDLRAMARQLEVAEAMAPTHPHPHGPDSALGNLVAGPFLAMVDKVRDRLTSSR